MQFIRIIAFIQSFLSLAYATKMIRTSSLLTCMPDSQLTASYFDVMFFPDNRTVVFDINAYTTISGNLIAKVSVITYGLNIINKDINLCSIGLTELCPLSPGAGRIDVSSNYEISKSIADMIPNVAYTVPDLDARVRVVAYSTNDTNTPLACVEAILTNGKTVQTKYASWPIAAISGLGLITSGVVSIIGHSNTAAHIASNSISLFVYFQNLAITSMMAVSRVPPIAAAWTQNFQWSMGIINVKFMQDAIRWYVQATGGTSTVVVENKNVLSISVQKRNFLNGLNKVLPKVASKLLKRANFNDSLNDSNLYTTDEHDTNDLGSKVLILRGIQRVAFLAGIEISNFFLTGVVFFLFFLFVLLIAIISFKGFAEILIRSKAIKGHKFNEFRTHWSTIIKGTLFRLALIALPQITLLSLWELTERDSAAIVVIAIFLLVIFVALLVYGATRVILIGRSSTREYKTAAYLLYGDAKILNRFGFLYVQFQAEYYWWLVPVLAYTIFRSLFVAVLQQYGKAQALIIFIIELIYFGCLCWIRPYMDKRTNVFNILIHFLNLFNSLMFLFFSGLFRQPDVVSSVCAVVLFVANAVFALFLLLFTIITCALALIYKNPDTRYQPMKDDRVSFIPRSQGMEKSNKKDTELLALGETVLSGQQPEQLQNQLDRSESDSENSAKFPQSRLPNENRFSRSDSLGEQVIPTSTVFGGDNLKKPGISFAQDTSYHGGNQRGNQAGNFYNSNDDSSTSFNQRRNPYEFEDPYRNRF